MDTEASRENSFPTPHPASGAGAVAEAHVLFRESGRAEGVGCFYGWVKRTHLLPNNLPYPAGVGALSPFLSSLDVPLIEQVVLLQLY